MNFKYEGYAVRGKEITKNLLMYKEIEKIAISGIAK